LKKEVFLGPGHLYFYNYIKKHKKLDLLAYVKYSNYFEICKKAKLAELLGIARDLESLELVDIVGKYKVKPVE